MLPPTSFNNKGHQSSPGWVETVLIGLQTGFSSQTPYGDQNCTWPHRSELCEAHVLHTTLQPDLLKKISHPDLLWKIFVKYLDPSPKLLSHCGIFCGIFCSGPVINLDTSTQLYPFH